MRDLSALPDDDLAALDALVREAVRRCLRALPESRRDATEVDRQLRRLVRRALRDLESDRRAFATPVDAATVAEGASGGRHGAPWSAAEEQRLRDAHAAGASIVEIARAHGRRASGIRSRLLRLGLILDADHGAGDPAR